MAGSDSSALERVEQALAGIAAHDAELRASVRTLNDAAIVEARRCDGLSASGVSLGPLQGLPIAVKDIIDVAGVPTESGSLTRKNNPPAKADAPVVAKLRAAGAIPLAKTHTVEFAIGGWGTNETVGTPHNPWDRATPRVPGGSSSGTGVLVGAGILRAGLGTDTGGSVRIPAAFCGCVGLKTSIGLVSRAGVTPLSGTLDTVGPLTRTVRTAADMLAVMQGMDPADPTTWDAPFVDPVGSLDRGVSGLRLARLSDDMMPDLAEDVRASFEKAVGMLREAGAHIGTVSLPRSLLEYQQRGGAISATEAYATYKDIVDDPASGMAMPNRTRMAAGGKLSAADITRIRSERDEDIRVFPALIDNIDAIILPTSPITAIPISDVDEASMVMSTHTRFGNYYELAALAVPIDLTPAGLPTSLQIVVRRYDDALALRIGAAFEAMAGPLPGALVP
jgi:aspartyl-tRNA(Asn)/glutamyl-tRNA(Gln) amidotransferase subunit A